MGSARMVDRFDRLRHHAVVGRHHQHRNVGGLGAARTHRREGGVARRVDEGDLLALQLDLVGADVLGDAARFAGHDVGVADGVEQRGLAVVDVAHDGHHRRPRLQILRPIRHVEHAFLDVGLGDAANRVAELRSNQLGGVGVDHVAGLHDLALLHEEFDDVDGALGHALRQFLDGDGLGQYDFAHDLLAWFLVQRALELLLPATHRRQRTGARVLFGQRRVERQLAAAAVLFALRLDGLGHFRLDDALQRSANAGALGLLDLIVGGCHLDLRRAAARFFLGTAAGLGLGQQASLFLGLAARRFLTLAAAALFLFGTALGVVGGAAAIFDVANLRAFKRLAARLHLVVRQLVEHHAGALLGGGRRLRRFLHDRRGSNRRLRRNSAASA